MLHINVNNPDELFNWMSSNISDDNDENWHLKSVEEMVSSGKANIHDRAWLEEKFLKEKGYRAHRLFVTKLGEHNSYYTLCYYQSRGKHNERKGKQLYWFEFNHGINGPYNTLDDLEKSIYDRSPANSRLMFSINSFHEPGMTLYQYVKTISFDKIYDPRFLSNQYVYGHTQEELPNDYPIYGLVDHSHLSERLTNSEYMKVLVSCKSELETYKSELSEMIKSGYKRKNWTIGQLLEKWKRIRRQIDTTQQHIDAIRSASDEYECHRFTSLYYLTNSGEKIYKNSIQHMINSTSVLSNIAFQRINKPVTNIFYEQPGYIENERQYEKEFIDLSEFRIDRYIEELLTCESVQLSDMLTSVIKGLIRW